ncbi:MAG: GIY-YIG nuclease family protein [Alphaproteobacteria bacterium]|nr:GIY-YIG nuclease family protein [Alphaproteobacteria bacterium]
MSKKKEIVYVLQNEAMPGLIKIGITHDEQVDKRLQTLYTTGVPLPFECIWAGEVDDCAEIESLIHNAFSDFRINPKREFFKLKPERVIPLLKKLASAEIMANKVEKMFNGSVSVAEKEAVKQFHRPMLDFKEMGISVGDELLYEKDPTIKVTVISNKKINFEGKEYSLSALTKKIRKLPYYVAPCKYWSYKGKNLDDIYNETYPLK